MAGPFLICIFLGRLQVYFGTTWFGEYTPDYFVPALVFIALHYSKTSCYWAFFVLGLFLDCFSLCPFGFHATLYLFLGYLLSSSKQLIYHENVWHQSFWAGMVSLGFYGTSNFLLRFYEMTPISLSWSTLFLKVIITFLVSIPILLLFQSSLYWFSGKTKNSYHL